MTKWEIHFFTARLTQVFGKPNVADIWTMKGDGGITRWDHAQELAAEGWELVGVTPIAATDGNTAAVLFTFKRPLPEPLESKAA